MINKLLEMGFKRSLCLGDYFNLGKFVVRTSYNKGSISRYCYNTRDNRLKIGIL